MTPAALLELGIVCGALAAGSGATIVALHQRAAARAGRLALRLARAREGTFVEAARRLADAARASVDAVRDELGHAVRRIAPGVDGVMLYEEHDGTLRCVYACGERVAYFAGSGIALDDAGALPVRARNAGHRVTLDDDGVRPLHPGDAAALAVPLGLDAGRACILVAVSPLALDPDTTERMVMLAEQAAPAYAVALERESDRRRAEYDGLTGLLTPRAFRTRLATLVERARLNPAESLALIFVDTDRFKQWNDGYGHAAGDTLLRELARLLRGAARDEQDLVARNGGDEFCLVFVHTEKSAAIERAEALRRRIAAAGLGNAAIAITASIGVAAYPADARSAPELLERADAAMYHCKRTGRDAVAYAGVDGTLIRLDAALA